MKNRAEKSLPDIIDYINWRGDIDILHDGFNEVDNLILSSLAYLEFDGIVMPPPFGNTVSLYETADKLKSRLEKYALRKYNPIYLQLPELFEKAIQSPRFRDIKVSRYTNIVDWQQSEQFSAVVFSITPELHFIAYRGTDDTIVGWKEDFEMSFLDEVPAQRRAVEYLSEISPLLNGRYYLGGHSKGGNLAVYAAAHIDREFSNRIIAVYNNDGPGFHTNVMYSAGYQQIVNRVRTYLPKSSVIGMMLEHSAHYTVVACSETGLMQHNPFSWGVEGPRFAYDTGISRNSVEVSDTVRAWLEGLSPEKRAEFVNTIFEVVQATGAKTLEEISNEKLKASIAMIKSFNHLEFNTRLHLISIITLFFKESGRTIRTSVTSDVVSWLNKAKTLLDL